MLLATGSFEHILYIPGVNAAHWLRILGEPLRTGATIIAVVEKSGKKNVNPGSDYAFTANSVLIIAGERKQLKTLKELLLHGTE